MKKKNGFIGIFTRRKKKKCYRCKFKTNKLNAQLGHVCFVFFCFSFSLSTVCPFLPGGGGKKTLLMLYACMSSARRPSLLVSSEELGVLEARHRLEGSPCLVQCQESFKSSSLSPFWAIFLFQFFPHDSYKKQLRRLLRIKRTTNNTRLRCTIVSVVSLSTSVSGFILWRLPLEGGKWRPLPLWTVPQAASLEAFRGQAAEFWSWNDYGEKEMCSWGLCNWLFHWAFLLWMRVLNPHRWTGVRHGRCAAGLNADKDGEVFSFFFTLFIFILIAVNKSSRKLSPLAVTTLFLCTFSHATWALTTSCP